MPHQPSVLTSGHRRFETFSLPITMEVTVPDWAPNCSHRPSPPIRPMHQSSQLTFILLLVAAVCCSGCRPMPPPKRVTTNIGLKLTYIPPGSFTMGANPSELGAKPAEKQHKVTLSKGYYLGIYEVTQNQYLRVMGKNPSVFQGEMLLKNRTIVESLEPGLLGHNHPVDHVTWEDAVEFCKRLSELPEEKKAGHVYNGSSGQVYRGPA